MGLSFGHLLVVAILMVLLFGRGRISDLMGDVAKGVKAFRKGMQDEDITQIDQKPNQQSPNNPSDRKDV